MKLTSKKRLLETISAYIDECRSQSDGKHQIFANIAGFCCYCNISVADFHTMKKLYPKEYALALAYFENAALNSGASAGLIGLYLHQYAIWNEDKEPEVDCDHDIYTDGI